MPQTMNEKEANEKFCPFMKPLSSQHRTMCEASKCACWGWSDSERGEIGTDSTTYERTEVIAPSSKTIREISPQGDDWRYSSREDVKLDGKLTGMVRYKFHRPPIVGPRRGQCEAMSPYIEVNCNA